VSDNPTTLSLLLDTYASISKPSSVMTGEVEGMLQSRREGIQVKAAQLLAKWQRPSSKIALRQWLSKTLDRKKSPAVRAQAAKALAAFVVSRDAEWILDLYFSEAPRQRVLSTMIEIHALLPLVAALPSRVIAERARAEAKSPLVNHRRAAVFALHVASDDRGLREMAKDESAEIRTAAKNLLARLAAV
jgi:hypothetical protein